MANTTEQKGENSSTAALGGEKPQHNPRKQSFASLFKDNRVPVEASLLKYITPPSGEVTICMEEIESVEKTFGFCLVGYVMGPRPSHFAVRNFVKRWGENVKFMFKDNGWIKFQFPNEAVRDAVLSGGPYMISGRQLFLKMLPSCFLNSKEDMVFLPSWVQIFGLPADCWTAPALSKIASVVGKPIHTDMLTITKKGLNYARVLVELDAKKPRVWELAVKLPTGKNTMVKFKYELEPKYCDLCNSLGHVVELCGVDSRKKNNTHKSTKVAANPNSAPADDMQHVGDNLEGSSSKPIDEPDCSSIKQTTTPAADLEVQQNDDHLVGLKNHGKGIEQQADVGIEEMRYHGKEVDTNHPAQGEQQQDDFRDDDLLSYDGTEHPTFNEEDFDLDSEDIDDLLSRVQTQDREEWKTVLKKNRRFKNKIKNETHYSQVNSGASSMETEYVTLDPISKLPLKGEQSRVFKKKFDEARRPKTAFGSP